MADPEGWPDISSSCEKDAIAIPDHEGRACMEWHGKDQEWPQPDSMFVRVEEPAKAVDDYGLKSWV
jgi:hypothetical protein